MQKTIELRATADVKSSRRPTLSLVLVAATENTVNVARGLLPNVDEVVVVVASTDSERCRTISHAFDPLPVKVMTASPATLPHLFTLDAKAALNSGCPFAGEQLPTTFEMSPFCTDRSTLLNMGLSRCSADWRVVLEEDDILPHPEFLLDLCLQLDDNVRDVGYGSHHAGPRSRLVARFSRNVEQIKFEGVARESLEGGVRPGIVEGNLVTRSADWSPTIDAAKDHEAFKALYAEGRLKRWEIPTSSLVHLARTAPPEMATFREACLEAYLENSLYPEERGWASCLLGEMRETGGDLDGACKMYESALSEHPSSKAALRLCRAEFSRSRFEECIDAYHRSIENIGTYNLCDDGAMSTPACMILVASSLHKLNRKSEAREMCDAILKLYPENQKIQELCRGILEG